MMSFRGRRRQGGEDAAAVEPAHAAGEDRLPVEVAGLQPGRRLVGAVVENHRRPHAVAPVAVDGGDVRPGHAVVREVLVERPDAHGPHPLRHQIADRVIDHGRRDAGLQAKAIGQVGGHVEFAAADVNLALRRLAKRHDSRVETVDQGPQGYQVQGGVGGDVERMLHAKALI